MMLSKLLKLSGIIMLYYTCVKLQLKNMELLWCFWCCQYKEINTLRKSRKYLQSRREINFYSIYSGHLCLLWLNFYYVKALHENLNVLPSSTTSFIFQLSAWGNIIGSQFSMVKTSSYFAYMVVVFWVYENI